MDPKRRLTREEFDAVIRRASELAAEDGDSGDLSEAELYRIAGEVGLPEGHVRRALGELRTGAMSDVRRPTSTVDRLFGPETVVGSRVVPGAPADIAREFDEFLVAGKLLEPLRRTDRFLQYRPAVDWISQIARAASSNQGRYYVASAQSVEVRLDPVEEDRTLVELEVDPGTRGDAVTGAVMGALFGGVGGGAGAAYALSLVLPWVVAVVCGVAVGAGLAGAIVMWSGRSHGRKLREIRAEVEGTLDKLQMGESLEPPPPSWRRWVTRHFHGARKLLDDGAEDEDG